MTGCFAQPDGVMDDGVVETTSEEAVHLPQNSPRERCSPIVERGDGPDEGGPAAALVEFGNGPEQRGRRVPGPHR